MKKFLTIAVGICSSVVALAIGGNTINIKSGTVVSGKGTVQAVMSSTAFVNNGTYIDTTGTLTALAGVTFSGSGTTTLKNLVINHASGSTSFTSLVSVRGTATITSGSVSTGANKLYLRTDINPSANLVNNGVLTGTVDGLVTNATVLSGGCPSFTSVLSHNVSGSVMVYQWQSSNDSASWTNVSGATNATYTPTVTATTFYRCSLTTSNSAYSQATPGRKLTLSGSSPTAITGTFTVCPSATSTLSSTPSGGTWSSSNTAVGTIGSTSGILTGVTAGTTTITYNTGCGTAATQDVTVNATPVMTVTPTSQSVCNNANTTVQSFTSSVGGTTYTWTNNNTSIGIGASGSGSSISSFTATNTGTTAINGVFTVTPTAAGCIGATQTFTVTVKPTPVMSVTPTSQTVCNNANTAMQVFSSNVGSTTYTWANNNTAIGIGASGSGSVITSFTATNTGASAINGVFTVTPTAASCVGGTQTFTITVSPTPVMTVTPTSQTVCNNANTSTQVFSSNVTGTTYTWSNSNTTIGIGASGSGSSIASFTATNTGASATNGVFTVTPTAASCVGAVQTFTIAVSPTPVMTVTPTAQSVCNNANTAVQSFTSNVAGTTYTWANNNTSIGIGASGSGSSIASFTGTNTGTTAINGVFTVTPTAASCIGATQTFTVTVKPTPVMSVTPTSQTVCNNANTSTQVFSSNVAGTTYTWANNNTTIGIGASGSGSAIASFTATNTGASSTNGVFTVTPTASSCVGATQTFTITVSPTPVMSVTPTSQTVCNGVNTSVQSFSSNVAGTTYAWANNNTTIGIGASGTGSSIAAFTATNTGATATNGVFTVTPTAASCVGAVQTFTITVSPSPNPGTISGTASSCVGTSSTLTASGTTGGTWSSTNTAVGTVSASGVVTGISGGTTTISYTVTNSCGTAAATQVFTVTASPSAGTISGTSTVCVASTTTLNSSVGGGVWSSSNTAIGTVGSSSGIVTGISAGTATISYTVTTGCGTGTSTQDVTVNARPSISSIGNSGPVCAGGTLNLSSTVTGGSGSYTYSWVGPNTFTSTLQNPSISSVTTNASGTYVLSATDGNSCSATGTNSTAATVNVRPTMASVSNGGPVCAGSTLSLSSSATGGSLPYSYSWAGPNTFSSTAQNPSITSVTTAAGGVYTVIVTDNNSCTATGTNTTAATINARPVITAISNSGPVCVGSTLSLSTTATGGSTPYGYSWAGPNTFSSTLQNPSISSVTSAAGGTYTVTVTDANGCTAIGATTTTATVNLNPVISAIGNNGPICSGSTLNLSTTITGGAAPIGYAWSGPASYSSTNNNPAIPSATTANSGVYSLTATDAFGCVATGTRTTSATVNALPVISSVSNDGPACATSTLNFTSVITSGSTPYHFTWVGPNSFSSTLQNPSITGITSAAIGTYTLDVTDNNGCAAASSGTTSVMVNPLPDAGTISGLDSVYISNTITLTTTGSGGSWSSSNTSVATVSAGGVVTGVAIGVVAISYSYTNTCGTDVATHTVSVNSATGVIVGNLNLCTGTNSPLTATGLSGGTWTSDNTAVATVVPATGVVIPVSAGTATISYTKLGNTTTAVVTVNLAPASITGGASGCTGVSGTLSSATSGGTWTSSNTSIATINASTGDFVGVGSGTVTISYTLASGCYKSTILTVNATAVITGSLSVCQGSTTTLSSTAGSGVSWTSSNTAVATIGSTSGFVTGLTAGTTNITFTPSTGCEAYAVLTVNSLPGSITAGSTVVCKGSTTTFSSTPSGGTWTSGTTAVATINSSTGLMNAVAAGTANITYTLTTGCMTSTNMTVAPVPAAITGTPSMCVGATTTLSDATPSCTWSSDNTSVAAVTAGVVSGLMVGTATISYTHSLGCAATQVVSVNAGPPTNGGPTTACIGLTTTLTNATSGGTWSSSNTGKALVGLSTGVVYGVSAGTANISYVTSPGCYSVTQVTVSATLPAITGSTYVNVGFTVFQSNSVAGGTWSSSNTAKGTIDASTGELAGIAAGTTTISYTVGSCFVTRLMTVNPPISPITGASSICMGSTMVMSCTTPGGVSWTSSNPGVATIGITSGFVTPVSPGTTTLTYTVGSGAFNLAVITVNALPTAISGTFVICEATSTTLASAGTGGGTWASSNPTKAIIGSATGIFSGGTAGGTGTITYTWTNGCKVYQGVTVNPLPALPAITGPGSVSIIGGPVTLTASTSGGTWASSNVAIATVAPTGAATASLTGVTAGNVNITYTVTNGCGTNSRVRIFTITTPKPGPVNNGNTPIVRVYPNPTSGVFTLEAPVTGTFTIFTIDGRMATQYTLTETTTQITLPKELAAGVYMCHFDGSDGSKTAVRLVYEQ